MRLVRAAIANVNTTVGAVRDNVTRAIAAAKRAAADGATIVAFPEQLVSGYPPEDLVQWRTFIDAQWGELLRFAHDTRAFGCVFVVGITIARDADIFNCGAVVHRGRVIGLVPKEKLPTYGVFYESRTFSPGRPGQQTEAHGVPFGDYIFEFDFGVLGLEICEDIWTPDGRCVAAASPARRSS